MPRVPGQHIAFPHQIMIVTGAAHGIGRAICTAFAAAGAQVWACDILDEPLAETAAACRAMGGQCTARHVDVTDREAIRAFCTEAEVAAGPVGVLVNNAGGVLGYSGKPIEAVIPTSGTGSWPSISWPASGSRRRWCPA
jgi:3-oxoacyl-[acyl-carrier protein] reductase